MRPESKIVGENYRGLILASSQLKASLDTQAEQRLRATQNGD